MRRGCNSRPFAPTGVGRRLRLLAPCALLLLLAGCVPAPAFDNDPLLGGRPLPRNGAPGSPSAAVAAAPKAPAEQFASATTMGSSSPAALAAGGPAPGDAGSLRIGQPPTNPGPPGALTSAPHDTGEAWNGTAGPAAVTLKQPQPFADPSVRPIAAIAPPSSVGAAPAVPQAADQYDNLQDMLSKRGVQFQSLEGPDEHGARRFSCGVPSRDPAGGNHIIELTAPGDHGLAAIRAAIDQIDQYQR
jgi:hypothetical protein